jgi:hypothetical protein
VDAQPDPPIHLADERPDRTGPTLWSGQMDEVWIYGRVLSDAEIAGLAGQAKPLHKPF